MLYEVITRCVCTILGATLGKPDPVGHIGSQLERACEAGNGEIHPASTRAVLGRCGGEETTELGEGPAAGRELTDGRAAWTRPGPTGTGR